MSTSSFFPVAQTYHSHVFYSKISQHWFCSIYFKEDHPTPTIPDSNGQATCPCLTLSISHLTLQLSTPEVFLKLRISMVYWILKVVKTIIVKIPPTRRWNKNVLSVPLSSAFQQMQNQFHESQDVYHFCSLLLPWFVVKNTKSPFQKNPTWKESLWGFKNLAFCRQLWPW